MFRTFKRITALSLSVLLLSIGSTVYATGGDDEEIHYPHSIKIIEESDYLGEELYNVDKKIENDISPQSSFVKYEANGYAGGNVYTPFGYNDKYMLFHNASVSIPSGVSTTYTWDRTVSKTNYSGNEFDIGARAQGGVKFVTEAEVSINKKFAKSKSLTITKGTKSETTISLPGSYNLNFYLKANMYSMYGDWWGTTIDAPNTRKKISRFLGYVNEATDFLHLEVTKR